MHFGGDGGTTGTTTGIGTVVLLVVLLATVGDGTGVGVGVGSDWDTQVRLATTYVELAGQQPPSLTILFGSLHSQFLSEARIKFGKHWVHF